MESVRLYKLFRVDKITLHKDTRYILVTEYNCFKTNYVSHIPIDITDMEFEQIKAEKKTYAGAKATPLLHKVKKQAIEYLKANNRFKSWN